ncbi:hypothetical protein BH18ACT11_BH18ACT11_01500 [soil metagenome]
MGGDRVSGETLLRGPRVRLRPLEKLGFVVEGRRRENHWTRGRFWDDILMGITAEEWWSKHGPPRPPDLGAAP